jgi:hypothetical protein
MAEGLTGSVWRASNGDLVAGTSWQLITGPQQCQAQIPAWQQQHEQQRV